MVLTALKIGSLGISETFFNDLDLLSDHKVEEKKKNKTYLSCWRCKMKEEKEEEININSKKEEQKK